jgi:hypothetical protein
LATHDQRVKRDIIRADIVARVCKLKLEEINHDLMHKQMLGGLAGMPTLWSLLILMRGTTEDIDKLVSAEIPREPTDSDNEETAEYLIRARTAVLDKYGSWSMWCAYSQ